MFGFKLESSSGLILERYSECIYLW